VALARALMAGTKLLLLDEPTEGLAPALARRLAEVLANLRGTGLTALIAESNDTHVGDLVDEVFVIERGGVSKR
jgi:branched-chain amino acid transport system ATP-binding protein